MIDEIGIIRINPHYPIMYHVSGIHYVFRGRPINEDLSYMPFDEPWNFQDLGIYAGIEHYERDFVSRSLCEIAQHNNLAAPKVTCWAAPKDALIRVKDFAFHFYIFESGAFIVDKNGISFVSKKNRGLAHSGQSIEVLSFSLNHFSLS